MYPQLKARIAQGEALLLDGAVGTQKGKAISL